MDWVTVKRRVQRNTMEERCDAGGTGSNGVDGSFSRWMEPRRF